MSEYRTAAQGYSTFALMRDLGARVYPYWDRFLLASLIRVIGDIAWLYPAIAAASIVDELVKGKAASWDVLLPLFVFLGIATILRSVSQPAHRLWAYWVAERVQLDVVVTSLEHLMRLDMVWHEKEGSGNKIQRIQNAASGMNRIIRMWFDMLIEIGVNFVGVLFVLSIIDIRLTWITIAFMVTYFPLSYFFGRKAALAALDVNKELEALGGVTYEVASNVRTVKILSLADDILKRVSQTATRVLGKIYIRISRYSGKNLILMLWAQLFNIGTLIFIAFCVIHGLYAVGIFVLFNRFFGQIRESVGELSDFSQEFMSSKLAIGRLNEMLRTEPAIDKRATRAFPEEWKIIRFENVSFSYGGGVVLKDITFTISRGEKIGIVGSSGAGKSTLFKLLLKERGEYEGEIYIDEVSLRDITRDSYFERVSAVLQDTEVFNLSLKDNIVMASKNSRGEEGFVSALRTAHVADFAATLPQQVDTIIGEKGVKLSGGERQRLGIARAIYKNPEILLMDEATSHLDSESEEKIRDSLSTFFEQVTAIVIAHRLSTIRAMDRILVIENGSIVESGSFTELIAKQGRFAELWEKQKL
jgi:ABC-type multidrug transport system fused ATPase/permease subunit